MRLFVFVKMFILLSFGSALAEAVPLEKLMMSIRKDYSTISHMTASELNEKFRGASDVLLLDVREKEEYEVSHLEGAIRVDPGIWTSTFMKTFKALSKGKTVIFYCSVGVRSSRLATRVKDKMIAAGAKGIYNLEGGIFYWHGSEFDLVNSKGKTDFVHPYNPYWGQLVRRRELLRSKSGRF